ncbi:bifunctional diguanylate cyclase/phosphodiesterase [Granulicella sp. dw_53]|uniref:putative bifunctional diguanylate cyclase/phosphodiesterase n=1 Tax=Granulicella sp. dw_53 TaxID=2719792 RepID=UPI001BD2A87F|nr:bifunctional diguanylate cyclase/phosphodiesterase [Granulicella sp. dw_53]
MNKFWLERATSGLPLIKHRNKILFLAVAGMQIPLLALICYFFRSGSPCGLELEVLGIAVVATLGATFLTLFVLNSFIQPIYLAAQSLRNYAQEGILPEPSAQSNQQSGTLLADTECAILKLDASLRQLTDFDPITSLPTRDAFMRILSRRMPAETHLAICAINVSNYDKIAAAFGQAAVGSVMAAIATRFAELLGNEVPLCRVDSNTFIFALELQGSQLPLAQQIESLRLATERELILPGFSLRPEMNAGVSLHTGGKLDAERLINEAISAMAESRLEGSVHTNFFSPRQNEQARDVFLLERDLRLAIEQEQFSVHYQPIVDTALGRVVGAEALVRWTHPERGMVSPAVFIPIAEASGLMDAIGMRVLHQVCRQLGRWAGTPLEVLKISINLSARQFLNPDAVLQICEALEENHVSPLNLSIELTETTVIQDIDRTLFILQALRKMGITIAIDDFGTGYSGLSYLKTLPFDRLKIDREFIQSVDQTVTSMAICKSLIELASGLGIEVLAEGTETNAEVGMMRSLGCNLYQGYHFARPLPPDELLDTIRLLEASLVVPAESESRSSSSLLDGPPSSALLSR